MATIVKVTGDAPDGSVTVLRVWNKKQGKIAKEVKLTKGQDAQGECSQWADVTVSEEKLPETAKKAVKKAKK
jgi:hypothetical protein